MSGFPTELTGGQLTQVRATEQRFKQYLVLCPNDIIWQTQPAAAVDGTTPYAEFTWDGTDQGDRADVKQGQTVLISTSTDYKTTTIFRGRVRYDEDAGDVTTATTLYINENSTNLEDTYYVTVLDDEDLHEKLERRTVDGTAYKDWSLTFETLPPLISGLQSVYVDISAGATVDIAFAPTVIPTANGATNSSYLWSDIGDGTITVGSDTDKDVTIQFPGAATNEHRWIRFEATDSNDVTQYFSFQVYTVDLADTSTNVIALNAGDVAITGTLETGFNADIRARAGISDVLDRTACAIFSVDDYDGTSTPITQNVAFVGRLRTESSTTAGDKRYGVLQDTRFTIEGFLTQLGRLHGPGLYLQDDSTPTAWGEIEALTIQRALVYMLAWHSTALNLFGLTFDVDSDDYRWPEFVIQEASLLEWFNSVADDQNAQLVMAADGQSTAQRGARIAGTDGLTTILTFEVDDSGASDIKNFTLDHEYIATYSQAIAGAATYNTTSNSVIVYQGVAPAQSFGPGWEQAQLNSQIMKVDLTESEAITETGSRAGNYLATVNPRPRLTVSLMPGYYWLVPSVHQLYAFDIEASDTTRGRAYTSADKWLCTEINYSYSPDGTYDVTGTFELIVAGGNTGILVTLVPDVNNLEMPILPGGSAGFSDILNPLVNYPVDDPDYELPGLDVGLKQPGPYLPQPPPGCEVLNVSMKTGSIVTTSESTMFGETYLVRVEGDGIVQASADWIRYYEFDETFLEGWVVQQGLWANPTNLFGIIVGSLNQAQIDQTFSGFDGLETVRIHRTWNQVVKAGQGIFVNVTHSGGTDNLSVGIGTDAIEIIDVDLPAPRDGVTYIEIILRHNNVGDGGSLSFVDFSLIGSGTSRPPGTVPPGSQYGDAFYLGYDAGAGSAQLYPDPNGFQVDSARPSNIPNYTPAHVYEFSTTGTGSPLGFRFLEADYSDNQNRNLVVTICGEAMKQG